MNPFYWKEGSPGDPGWYMVAYVMQGQWLYAVGFWEGTRWYGRGAPAMWGCEPQLFHKITPPNEFFEELEREATERQRLHITAETHEDEDATNHFPFLGTN